MAPPRARAALLLHLLGATNALRPPARPMTRGAAMRAAAAAAAALALPARAPAPAAAAAAAAVPTTKLQADDKSWDLALPKGWSAGRPVRPEAAGQVFRLAARDGGAGRLEVAVDKARGAKSLAALGALDEVAERLRAEQPQPARLLGAARVAGAVKGSSYYAFRFGVPGGERAVRLAAYQERTYRLTVESAAGSPEVDAIVGSFTAWPVNIICLSQSNGGAPPVAGSCY